MAGHSTTIYVTMPRVARLSLLVLIAFAFIVGTSSHIAHTAESASPMMMAGMPCDMGASHAGMHHDKSAPPCKGMTLDCVKHMGCVAEAALPARIVDFGMASLVSSADYWPARSKMPDFVPEPEPLPPRTI